MNKLIFSFFTAACCVVFSTSSVCGQTGSIGGRVVKDFPNGGVVDAGDTVGISGVTIVLKSTNNNTVAPYQVATALTDANGYFLFPNLGVDFYVLFPSNYNGNSFSFFTPSQAVNLAAGQSVSNLKVGYYFPPPPQYLPISGKTFVDSQPNNILDAGEVGLAGVKVYLDSVRFFNQGSFSGILRDSTISDANGNFTFPNLPNNVNYLLRFVAPSDGYVFVSANAQSNTTPYQSSATRFTNIAVFKLFNCPNDTTVTATSGQTAVVNYPPPTGNSGYCPNPNTTTYTLLSGLATGANFPIGTTPVKLQVNFTSCGANTVCQFNVTVNAACIAPAITSQTTNSSLDVGQTAAFNVVVTGSPTITYRWFKTSNPTATLGTTATFSIPSVSLTDAGAYQCEISNVCGTIISATANLTVNLPCTPPIAPYVGALHAIAGCGNVGGKAQRRDANFQGIGGLTFEWYEFDATMPDNRGVLLKIQTTTNADPISFYNWNPTPSATTQTKTVLVYENLGGCYSPKSEIQLTVFPQPTNDLTIAGLTTDCGQININAVPTTPLLSFQSIEWWKNGGHDVLPNLSVTPNFTTTDASLNFVFAFKTEFRPHVAGDLTCFSDPLFVDININPLPIVSITNLSNNYCKNAAPITLSGLPIGGSFTIDGIAATNWDPSVLSVGNHVVTYNFTDVNGCSNSISQNIVINAQPSIVISANPASICSGQTSQLTAVISGLSTGYTISWDNGLGNGGIKTTPVLAVSTMYNVTVTTTTGCSAASNALTVEVSPEIVFAVTTPPTITSCEISGISFPASTNFTGGTAPFQLQWLKNGNAVVGEMSNILLFSNLTVANSGVYTLQVTDAVGCSAISPTVLTLNIQLPPTANATFTPILCNGGTSTLTATPSYGAISNYQYSIDGGATFGASNVFTVAAGTYQVIVYNPITACFGQQTVVITQPNAILATITATNGTCSNPSGGQISVNASGGTPPYQFNINGGAFQTSNIFTNLTAGNYALIVTDVNACSITINQNITGATPPQYNATFTPILCFNQKSTLTITPTNGPITAFKYSINGGTTFKTTNIFTNVAAGTYQIVVVDAANAACSSTSNVTITQPTALLATVAKQNITCNNLSDGQISVVASGGTSPYQVNFNGAGFQANTVFPNLNSGTYNLIIKDVNNCLLNKNGNVITNPSVITLVLDSIREIKCNGASTGRVYTTGTGGTGGKMYSKNNGTTWQASSDFSNLTAGTYNLLVKDANNCLSNAILTTLNEPSAIVFSTTKTNETCNEANDGTITVTASGGTGTLEFSRNNGSTYQISPIFTGLLAGNYAVKVRDANGCATVSQTVNISQPTVLAFSTTVVISLCNGGNDGKITITASGGTASYSYILNGGTSQTSNVFLALSAGSYAVKVVDANGCNLTKTVVVGDPSVLTLVLDSTKQIKCNSAATGRIYTTGTGGTGSKMYSKNNGTTWQSSSDFVNLPAGTYNLLLKDANNCLSNAISTTLTEPTVLGFSSTKTNETCNDANNGTITVTASGGVSPHEYSRNNGSTYQISSIFTGLAAGNYALKVRDANGCITASQTVTITQPLGFTFATVTTPSTCNGIADAKIVVRNYSGGNGGLYQFSKDNGANYQVDSAFLGLSAGNYFIKIRDVNGCESLVRNLTVTQPAPITFATVVSDLTCGLTSNGVIGITTVAGGTPQYKYSKNGGTTFQNSNAFVGLLVGTYPIQVKDSKGCLSAIANSSVVNGCPTQDLRIFAPPTPTQRIPIVIHKLSPNPTESELNLEVNSWNMRTQQFQFYNFLGKQVQTETRTLEQGINRLTFDCSALPQGAYLIITPESVGSNQPRKFIKL